MRGPDAGAADTPLDLEVRAAALRADLPIGEAALSLRASAFEDGVTMTDPASFFLCADTRLGRDVTIGPNVVFGPGVHLISLVRAHVGVVTDDIERASVFVHEWRALDKGRRDDIARRRDAYEARFRTTIDHGVSTGSFEAVDPTVTAALFPGLYQLFILASSDAIAQVAEQRVDLQIGV